LVPGEGRAGAAVNVTVRPPELAVEVAVARVVAPGPGVVVVELPARYERTVVLGGGAVSDVAGAGRDGPGCVLALERLDPLEPHAPTSTTVATPARALPGRRLTLPAPFTRPAWLA